MMPTNSFRAMSPNFDQVEDPKTAAASRGPPPILTDPNILCAEDDTTFNSCNPSENSTRSILHTLRAALVGSLNATPVAASIKKSAQQAQQEREQTEVINHYWTKVCFSAAVSSVAFALLAMMMYPNLMIRIAFIFPLFTAPFVVRQRRELNKLPCEYPFLNIFTACSDEWVFFNCVQSLT